MLEKIINLIKILFSNKTETTNVQVPTETKEEKETETLKKITINGKSYYYYNVDDNKVNYSQRNNKYDWGSTNKNAKVKASTMCNVTSICMALDYAGYKFPEGKFDQPEDNLAEHIMNSKLVDSEYAKRYPAMYKAFKNDEAGCYTPNEVHKLLEIGVNEWMGCPIDTFNDSTPIVDIVSDIADKQSPVVISGAFPQKKADGSTTLYHHIVCLVGVAFEKPYTEGMMPDYFVVDDPWGYTHDYSTGKSGNDVFISKTQFLSWLKPVNNEKVKFAHRLTKPVAVV